MKAVVLDHENEIEIACAKNIALIADDNFIISARNRSGSFETAPSVMKGEKGEGGR